jgi:hypothetical protein
MRLGIDQVKFIARLLDELAFYTDFYFDREEMGDLAADEDAFRLLRIGAFYLTAIGRPVGDLTLHVIEKSQASAEELLGHAPLLFDPDDPLLTELAPDPVE